MTQQARTFHGKTNRSIITSVVWLFILGLITLTACTATPTYSEADQAAIYAAVIQRVYTEDDTFGGTLNPPTLYIVRTTDDSMGDPDLEQSAPKLLSEALQSSISQAVADLPTQLVWVDDRTKVPVDATTGAVSDKGAIITLGNIHPQKDGSALVSGSIYVAMLAAGGQTYVVEQVNGTWQVSGNTGVLWMS